MSEAKEAEKKTGKEKKPKKVKKKGGFGSKLKWLLFIIASVFVLRQSVIMMMVGLLPAFVAWIVDTTTQKSWFKTVFCLNMAALLPYLTELYFEQNNSASAMQTQMGDFTMWLIVYGAAGFSWVLIWLCPIIATLYFRGYHELRAEEHRRKFEKLKQEWGISMTLAE